MESVTGKWTFRAIRDFEPSQMNVKEKRKLHFISWRIRKQMQQEQHLTQGTSEMHQRQPDGSEIKKHQKSDKEIPDYNENAELKESGLPRQDNRSTPKDDFRTSDRVCSIRVEKSDIQDQEQAKTTKEQEAVTVQKELATSQMDLQGTSRLDECSELEDDQPCKTVLAFKTGDKMETIHPSNIGDIDGWLRVKHVDSGNIGYIPRNCVVIESDHHPSDTTLRYLPLEMLDVILENSYLYWILNSSKYRRGEDVIRVLASVDFCWFQRITKRRLKRRVWKRLNAVYYKTKRRNAIVRNNRNYLLENIHLHDEMMLTLNCLTDEQINFIQRQRANQDKNAELLYFMESFDEAKFSKFVKCLRQTNQKTVANVLENGGAVIRIEVTARVAKCTGIHKLHKNIENFRNRTAPWSYQTDDLVTELWEEDIEILNSQMDRRTVVVWMWCRSQEAVETLQELYESDVLRYILFEIANITPSFPGFEVIAINIDSNHFKKTVVVSSMSINLIKQIGDERAWGICKLQKEIYVACHSIDPDRLVIHVFEDRKPFRLTKKIEKKKIRYPSDMVSSEKDNCLYVSDHYQRRICKITKETDDEYTIIKWLTTDHVITALSVSRNGHLMFIDYPNLMIYGSDAKLIRSVQFPRNFWKSWHAVETSIGNFIILHHIEEERENYMVGVREIGYFISELTSDGQTVVRRFNSPHEDLMRYFSAYLALDSDDQVFLAGGSDDTVTFFDSDLKWNPIIYPTEDESEEEEEEERAAIWPHKVCYDEENKQLIVAEDFDGGVNVYSLSRK